MNAEKIAAGLAKTMGIAGAVILVLVLIVLAPVLTVWVVNSLAESAGTTFYLEHKLWNYFLVVLALLLVHGGRG